MKNSMNILRIFHLSAIFIAVNCYGQVTLPRIFTGNMVLQRDIPVPVWGCASPGEKVSVKFNGQSVSARASRDGRWMVKLAPLKAGGPFDMIIKGKTSIILKNVLVGEVWICSGQSNMELPVSRIRDGENEAVSAAYPNIRLFTVSKAISNKPERDIKEGEWMECSPETVGGFSAVGYFFGRNLHKELNVPIGLINTSWGGTVVETWISAETINRFPDFKDLMNQLTQLDLDKIRKEANEKTSGKPIGPNSYPTLLYNSMVNPIIPYAIKGVIWYQGESNASRAYQYRSLFPGLITDWRSKWIQGDFPFLFVQLANYKAVNPQPGESDWAELREAQTMTLSLPKTGMAVIIDIGDEKDIHPRNKQDVGLRLSLEALKIAYGKEIVSAGPLYQSMSIEGSSIRISFSSVGSGLVARDKYQYLKGFAIAGEDKKFVWAKAWIEGNTVVVTSEGVKNPVAVRYAWANNPDDANLYNIEGLPASPFRTDIWPGITINNK